MAVDLESLPEISFLETDPGVIESDGFAVYEAITGRSLSPGDPERLFIEALLFKIALLHQRVQEVAFLNLVAKSKRVALDHLGARVDCPRLKEAEASTTVRYMLAEARSEATIIPAGEKITPDSKVLFVLESALEIPAGQMSGDVRCVCEVAGAAGNGFVPGQISKMVKPLPYIASVANITTSSGGADEEKDDPYRVRIMAAPRSFSVAGPAKAYKWWAKTAHQDIVDVSYRSPTPGVSELRPLMKGGEQPSQEILDSVHAICGHDGIRPDTDSVVVAAPEQVSYGVAAQYWILKSNAVAAEAIKAAVEKAYDEWLVWQRSKLGRDIDPSELSHRLKKAGAKRVAVTLPEFIAVAAHQVAAEDSENCSLEFKGLEDE